jgi:hypothetical protein
MTADVGLGSLSELTARFELGADASPDWVVSSIACVVSMVGFQAGLNRAATFVAELEDEVGRRMRSSLDPAPASEWLAQHASSFGLDQPNIIELLNAQAARWGNEQSARIRADLAAEVFLSEEAVTEGRLASLATNWHDWRISYVEYRNPLEIIAIGAGAAAFGVYKSVKWILDIVNKVQDTQMKAIELKSAQSDLGRVEAEAVAAAWRAEQARLETLKLTWELERTQVETAETLSEENINRETQALRAESRHVEELEAERARLSSEVVRLKDEIARKAIISSIQSSSPIEITDRQRNAVLVRLLAEDESTPSPQPYQQVVQATINVAFKTTVPEDLPATAEQAGSLAKLPPINEVHLAAPDG